ncbi:hypothetical protein ACWIUD_02910 [Helicobacter sp. 23-1044]
MRESQNLARKNLSLRDSATPNRSNPRNKHESPSRRHCEGAKRPKQSKTSDFKR